MPSVRKRSRKPSSTNTPRLPDPVFFIDADLSGRAFLEVLTRAGIRLERHDDHFQPGTDDREWLQQAGRNGWIVVTHNKKIRRTSSQAERLMEAGVRAFMLIGDARPNPPGQRAVFIQELAENFARSMPQILRFLRRHEAPWIAKLYRPAPAERSRPGHIQMWLTLQAWLKEI